MTDIRIAIVSACLATLLIFNSNPARADSFMLDYGNVVGSGDQITITRLPIVRNNGKVIYKDVIIKFGLNKKRNLIVLKKFPKTTNSTPIMNADLVAGRYQLNNSSWEYDLIGPTVGPNGRSLWTLVGTNNSLDMTFYTGPVKGHPLEQRIKDAGINSSPFTFGFSSNGHSLSNRFGHDCLIAAHMVGSDLKLDSHSAPGCGSDNATPTETDTMRHCPSGTCD